MPTGAAVSGVTLAGKLAGHVMYLMLANMAPASCWIDSQAWTGSEFFFGISSINWTTLNQQSTLSYNGACSPSPAFASQSSPGTTGNFNLYRAVVSGVSWVLTSLPLNLGQTTSLAAPKISGSTLVFVKYEKSGSYGNIYLSTRTGDNAYSTPMAFALNSASCNEDNPFIYNNGTQIIFESNRANAAASSCGSVQKLWASDYNGTSWTTPTLVSGSMQAATNSVTQPFLDSTGANFYWSGTGSDCAGSVTGCVFTAGGSGTAFSTGTTQLISPITPGVGWAGGGMLGLVGQYTEGNGYAFVACGIVQDVDPTSSTAGLIFSRFAINIQTCVIPL